MDIRDILVAVMEGREDEAAVLVKEHLTASRKELFEQGKDFIAQSIFEAEDDEEDEEDEEDGKDIEGKDLVPKENAPGE